MRVVRFLQGSKGGGVKKNRQFKGKKENGIPDDDEIKRMAKICGRSFDDMKAAVHRMKETIDRANTWPMAPKEERERILQRFTDLQFAGQPGYERNELLGFHEGKDDE